MNKIVFKLTQMADALEAEAKAYRLVASKLMGEENKPKKKRFYKPGTHWTQKPENRKRVIELARKRGTKSAR